MENIMTECPFAQASSWDATCSKLASEEVPVIVYQNLNKGSE